MTARDLIHKTVTREYREKAHVRAFINEDSWWHVHRDEELPDNHPLVVYIEEDRRL